MRLVCGREEKIQRKLQAISAAMSQEGSAMDVRLIPEFDGSNASVEEWLDKTELVCQLRGVTDVQTVVPLRLTGGAFSVYQQLKPEEKLQYSAVKAALLRAFAVDKFQAYEEFTARRLRVGESVDVYLADLRRLASLFGGLGDTALMCGFVAGLPEAARHTLRAGCRMESLTLAELVERARALMAENAVAAAAVAAAAAAAAPARSRQTAASFRCYRCGRAGHFARDCRTERRADIICFRCDQPGHAAARCPERVPGNASGEAVSAPTSSRATQE